MPTCDADPTIARASHPIWPFAAVIVLLLATGIACSSRYPDISGSAEILRAAALDQAKKEHKQVFLLFTQPNCEWCRRYDAYHSDPEVMQIIGKHFVLLKIDVMETPGGQYMFPEYDDKETEGLPLFSILDSGGITLVSSADSGQNIGFPTTPSEVDAYLKLMTSACPSLQSKEIDALRRKLESYQPEKAE
jgi:thioredoxin-related protein